jgi:Zn-dependent peptidase ImmA (M78 family)
LARHCLRAASAGLLLPRLCLFGSGRGVFAQWTVDDPDAYPHMPGSFASADSIHLDEAEAERGLREFVVEVLSRVADMQDPRVARARANWEAVSRAAADEQFFCRAAGRMGLDPYASADWPPGLLDLLETGLGNDPDKPLLQDFLESANGETAKAQWQWTTNVEKSLALHAAPPDVSRRFAIPDQYRPAKTGYAAARSIRDELGIPAVDPIGDLSEISKALKLGPLASREVNHVADGRVRAVVGWGPDQTPVVAGPIPNRSEDRRFLEARGLYHAIYTCSRGARLVTKAHTWDQQASRGFAAELLAPQAPLLDKHSSSSEEQGSLVAALASHYRVSTRVVEHQLENAGVGSMD